MANHACIAVGINRYQFLPPLSYGQSDAEDLQQFLVGQANLPLSQCLLLTDTSPIIGDQSTYPTRETILSWLEAGRQNSRHSEHWRWFFFSGYGVSWEQVDYLMPIDGNLNDIPGTGISVRSLFASLKEQGSDNILVLLDINRSPGLQAGTHVGARAVELANQMGITLMLSSQLDELSHEAAALKNGLFTEVLLEALHHYQTNTTLGNLDQYLRDRLPELCQHHWRPIQIPLVVIPSEDFKQQLILPTAKNSSANNKTAASNSKAFTPKTGPDNEDAQAKDFWNGTPLPRQKTSVSAVEKQFNTSLIPMTSAISNRAAPKPTAVVPYPDDQSEPDIAPTPWWQHLLFWGGAVMILALLISAVVIRNRDAFITQPVAKELPTPNPNASSTPSLNHSSKSLTDSAPPLSRLQANQVTLEQAKHLLRPNQATLFHRAIIQTRSIKSSDPLYQQVQKDIKRWNEVILDLAEGRAEKGYYGSAIAAAQLVTKDSPSVYAKAQQTIEQLQLLSKQQQQNQGIIQAAKQQIQPNQATSYNRAIAKLSQIPPDQPGYAEAQLLIDQFSRTIYLMAQSRAARGDFQLAIQTAANVPAGTSSSEAAEKAIAKWKEDKR